MDKLYSFDVFDTCLFRKAGSPEEIFYQTGRVVFNNQEESFNEIVEEYVERRIQAEKYARLKHESNEIFFHEIWDELCNHYSKDFCDKLRKTEIEIEEVNLLPNTTVLEIVNSLRATGCRVLFISDTYFTEDYLFYWLSKVGFIIDKTEIYCSCRFKKSKANTDFYEFIANREAVLFSKWTHYGDNFLSDVQIPMRLGINAIQVRDSFHNHIERHLSHVLSNCNESKLFVNNLRCFRLLNSKAIQNGSFYLVNYFLGPILFHWGKWVVDTAKKNRVKKLYFASRDARLLFETCKLLDPNEVQIEYRYFYISRQAVFLASARDVNEKEFSWLFREYEINRLDIVLNKLAIKYEQLLPELLMRRLDWKPNHNITKEDQRIFFEIISKGPIYVTLRKEMDIQRNAALTYFKNIGLTGSDCAIVDLGWYKTGQSSVNKILNNTDNKVKGIFLGLKRGKIDIEITGPSFGLFYEKYTQNLINLESILFDNNTLLEHLLGISDHKTVTKYEFDENKIGIPKFENVKPENLVFFNAILLDLRKFIEYQKSETSINDIDIEFSKNLIIKIIQSFLGNPDKTTLDFIRGIKISTHQNNENEISLINPISLRDVINNLGNKKIERESDYLRWYKADLKITSKRVKFFMRISKRLYWFRNLFIYEKR